MRKRREVKQAAPQGSELVGAELGWNPALPRPHCWAPGSACPGADAEGAVRVRVKGSEVQLVILESKLAQEKVSLLTGSHYLCDLTKRPGETVCGRGSAERLQASGRQRPLDPRRGF